MPENIQTTYVRNTAITHRNDDISKIIVRDNDINIAFLFPSR